MISYIFKNNLSRVTIIIVVGYALFKGFYYKNWRKNNLIQDDVISYYAYLPALIIHHDLSLEFVDHLPKNDGSRFWFYVTPDHKRVIKMTSGVAILLSPFFLIAHTISSLARTSATGFTSTYQFFLFAAALFYFLVGLFFLRKSLLYFFEDRTVALTIICVSLGTNLLNYTVYECGMSHVYSFCLVSLFLWLSIRWHEKVTRKNSIWLGLIGGLITLIRPTNIIIFLIPLFWNINNIKSLRTKFRFLRNNWRNLFLIIITAFIAVSPQLFYWKYATGHWLYYSYTDETFFFNNPHIAEGLFGFRKGFFIYTPIMFFIIPGWVIAYKNKLIYALPVLVFFLINIYIIFSWWCWWYGGSFGMRTMIDSYTLLALPLASFISFLLAESIFRRIILYIIIVGTFILNIYQMEQYHLSLLRWDGMSLKAYLKIFGTMNFPKDYELLLTPTDLRNAKKGLPARNVLDDFYLNLRTIDSIYVGIKTSYKKYVCYDKNLNSVVANRDYQGEWETFLLIQHPGNIYTIKTFDKKYIGVVPEIEGDKIVVWNELPNKTELFRKIDLGKHKFALQAYNSTFVSVTSDSVNSLKMGSEKIGTTEIFELVSK